jgi:DNA-binding transcriptional regulator/RsmH inhibitor MraZ
LVQVRRENDRLVVTASTEGTSLDGRGRLHIPETERRALSLCAQSGVLLSADKRVGVLMVTPAALCDELVS